MPNTKKVLIKKLPKFESDVYANLTFGDLVLFALSYLAEQGIEANTEEIISACFRLFPHKFGLKNYSRWPDSALVMRHVQDVKKKKLVKGNASAGFMLTFKGKQSAKRVAKLLGIKKKSVAKKKQKPVALVLTKKTLRRRFRKPVQNKVVKKKRVVKRSNDLSRSVKKATKVATTQKRGLAIRATKKGELKIRTTRSKKVGHAFSVTKKDKTEKRGLPIRATEKSELAIRSTRVKKKITGNKKQVGAKQEALQVVKIQPVVNVSKEEKIKAGRVVHQVEKSDAYKAYLKNGKISEFDFRNMLFATMESSADTLTRNVALFKKYANMQSRNDVIKFLNFCESSFAKLLKR